MYPEAYIEYLAHFHGLRDYFECHEILEEHWKQDPRGNRKLHWVGLIQIAVGLYHHRRGNLTGAKRMISNARRIVSEERKELENLAIDVDKLSENLTHELQRINNALPYNSFEIPLTDNELLNTCKNKCLALGWTYGSKSDLANIELIDRHTRRDRTEVIEERKQQQQLKQQKRNG
jgi:predicted metal-dependent hydrolase